jgi:hypothetical protein
MDKVEQHVAEPATVSGWVCVAVGIGFVLGVAGLLILVRGLSG